MNKRFSWSAFLAAGLVVAFLIVKHAGFHFGRDAAQDAARDAAQDAAGDVAKDVAGDAVADAARDAARKVAADAAGSMPATLPAGRLADPASQAAPDPALVVGRWRDGRGLITEIGAGGDYRCQQDARLSIPVDADLVKGMVAIRLQSMMIGRWTLTGRALAVTFSSADNVRVSDVRLDAPDFLKSAGAEAVRKFEESFAARMTADLSHRMEGKRGTLTILSVSSTTLSLKDGDEVRNLGRVR